MAIKEYINNRPRLKKFIHGLLMHPVRIRPRWYIRLFQFLYIHKGPGSVIYSSVRRDIVPFRRFSLGTNAVVESFSVLNNAVGDITIGDYSRVGIGNTIIGPAHIGDYVQIGQHVLVTGINHKYDNYISLEAFSKLDTKAVFIDDYVWIGANACILPGVKIGYRAVVGAGAVVTKDVKPYTVVAGNPAKVIKYYDRDTKTWYKNNKS